MFLFAFCVPLAQCTGDIEANVERTYSDATSGREELLKAEIYQVFASTHIVMLYIVYGVNGFQNCIALSVLLEYIPLNR